jgi:hypothetical protein
VWLRWRCATSRASISAATGSGVGRFNYTKKHQIASPTHNLR